jgi:hypothetical protein
LSGILKRVSIPVRGSNRVRMCLGEPMKNMYFLLLESVMPALKGLYH